MADFVFPKLSLSYVTAIIAGLIASIIANFFGAGSYSNIFDESAGPTIIVALAVTFVGSKFFRGGDRTAEASTLISLPLAGVFAGVVATLIEDGGIVSVFVASGVAGTLCRFLPIYFLILKKEQ